MKEDNTNMEKNTNESGQIKKSFLDFNFSWIMLVIDLALIFGLGTLNLNVMQQHSLAMQSTLYIVIVVGVSLIANFLFYTLGKLIGGLIGGYQVTKVVFFGMTIIFKHDGKDNDVSFKVNNILDFHLVMTPKKEKTCHYGYLLGGMVGYILINVVALLLALLVFSGDKIISYSILFGIGYGFIVALYELFPCRLDYVNDCFILIKTTHKEDLLAYENELKNIRHSLLGEDLEIIEFDNYDSYYKSHVRYYQYMDALLKDDIDKAINILEDTFKYIDWYTDDLKTKMIAEKLFILLSSESFDEAENYYSLQKKDFQNSIVSCGELSMYRIAVLIEGIINNMKEDTETVVNKYAAYLASHKDLKNARFLKEQELFNKSLAVVNKARPGWNLVIPQVA